jgi:hypothetical protein
VIPGPLWLRIILVVLLVVAVLAALVLFVFPWLNTFVNVNDVTVGT